MTADTNRNRASEAFICKETNKTQFKFLHGQNQKGAYNIGCFLLHNKCACRKRKLNFINANAFRLIQLTQLKKREREKKVEFIRLDMDLFFCCWLYLKHIRQVLNQHNFFKVKYFFVLNHGTETYQASCCKGTCM
jgi:hypothetical protein